MKEDLGDLSLMGKPFLYRPHLPGSWECVVVFGVLCCYLDHPAIAFGDLIWLFLGPFHLIPFLFIHVLLLPTTSFLVPTFEDFSPILGQLAPASFALATCTATTVTLPASLTAWSSPTPGFSCSPLLLSASVVEPFQ